MNYWKIIKEIKFIHETLNNANRHDKIDIDISEDIDTSLSIILYELVTNIPTDVLRGIVKIAKEGEDNDNS